VKIIVPVAGSASANRAVEHALGLAGKSTDAEIILVNVQNQQTLEVSDVSAVISADDDREAAAHQSKKALRRAIGLCRKAEVQFEALAELGPVAETVARLARELKADQIVMGTRGLGALRGLVLGSVAANVIRLAEIPVTLIK
jgi:nucleotide-binding universal stress UspA family protein